MTWSTPWRKSAFIAAAMKTFTGVPYVYDMDSSLAEQLIDAYPALRIVAPVLRRLEAFAVRRSAGVLTVCAALEDVAHGHAPDTPIGRVEDTTLLAPAAPGAPRHIPAEAAGSPVAMYVGNLESYQGIDLLLEGFRHTLDQMNEARLVIVGGQEDDIARYGARATELGIGKAVHFLGPKPVSVLADLLREADVLVSPRLKGLNTPMKIYSYLDSGTAVLATRLRTHTQVLDDHTAYLVEPEPMALGTGLATLLKDDSLREGLAARAKDHVQREFTPAAARRKLEIFYTMIESRSTGTRAPRVKQFWRSPTIRTAAVYGAAGAGFAIANLILARVLSAEEYALVTLVLALVNVGFALAPAGIDGIVNRRDIEAGPQLFRRVMLATTATGVVFALIGAVAYETSAAVTAMIFFSTAIGGALMVAAAKFQSEQRFGISLTLFQSPNIILLIGALATLVAGVREAWLALLIMTLGWVPGAAWGWAILFRERHTKGHAAVDFSWSESLSFAGVQATGLLLIQLERLVLPHVLPLADLATYGVLAAIAGSLFRVLQMGVGYTMFPRLRAAEDRAPSGGTWSLKRRAPSAPWCCWARRRSGSSRRWPSGGSWPGSTTWQARWCWQPW